MAGAACKIIIDNGFRALTESLERILIDPAVNGGRIPERERRDLIDELARIDTAAYNGEAARMTLQDVMIRLEALEVLSPDVWKIYTPPREREGAAPGGNGRDA